MNVLDATQQWRSDCCHIKKLYGNPRRSIFDSHPIKTHFPNCPFRLFSSPATRFVNRRGYLLLLPWVTVEKKLIVSSHSNRHQKHPTSLTKNPSLPRVPRRRARLTLGLLHRHQSVLHALADFIRLLAHLQKLLLLGIVRLVPIVGLAQ